MEKKKNVSLKLNVGTADKLIELLDAFKEEGKGDRAEAFDVLLPHIEAALAVDVAPAISGDVQIIRDAAMTITSRMDAIARAYAMVDAIAREDYKETLASQAGEIQELKQLGEEAEEAHAAQIAEMQARLDVLRRELEAAQLELVTERQRLSDMEAERKAWNDEREAMTAQMKAVTERLLAH